MPGTVACRGSQASSLASASISAAPALPAAFEGHLTNAVLAALPLAGEYLQGQAPSRLTLSHLANLFEAWHFIGTREHDPLLKLVDPVLTNASLPEVRCNLAHASAYARSAFVCLRT